MCFRSKSRSISDLPPARVPDEVERPRMSAEEKRDTKTKLAAGKENQEYDESMKKVDSPG
jgi:hypothetical protein